MTGDGARRLAAERAAKKASERTYPVALRLARLIGGQEHDEAWAEEVAIQAAEAASEWVYEQEYGDGLDESTE